MLSYAGIEEYTRGNSPSGDTGIQGRLHGGGDCVDSGGRWGWDKQNVSNSKEVRNAETLWEIADMVVEYNL